MSVNALTAKNPGRSPGVLDHLVLGGGGVWLAGFLAHPSMCEAAQLEGK